MAAPIGAEYRRHSQPVYIFSRNIKMNFIDDNDPLRYEMNETLYRTRFMKISESTAIS